MDRDETIRPESSVDTLGTLRSAFTPGGSVTAGNAPGVSDGAAHLSEFGTQAFGINCSAMLIGS